jgi:hypothetical protein
MTPGESLVPRDELPPRFVVVNLRGLGEVETDAFVADMTARGYGARAVPPERAADVAALFLNRPEAPEPGLVLATENDICTFLEEIDQPQASKMGSRVWNLLHQAARVSNKARDQLMAHPADSRPSPDSELALLASTVIRFFPPRQESEGGSFTDWQLDVGSLRQSLGMLLAHGYTKASGLFRNVGPGILDLMARFADSRFPDEPPLPRWKGRRSSLVE